MSLIGTWLGNPKAVSARDWQQCHRLRESKSLPRCQNSIWETLDVEVVEGKETKHTLGSDKDISREVISHVTYCRLFSLKYCLRDSQMSFSSFSY
jgi:hypothetical protein